MTAVILHLSDIHIKTEKDPILKRGADVGACLYKFLPSASHVFIVVSGDVAFSGEASEYQLAKQLLNEIREAILAEKACPISFVVVPGNHDCDFRQSTGARTLLVKSLEESNVHEIDSSIIETCTAIQKAFFSFRNDLENNPEAYDDLLWRSSHFEVEGKVLIFECLNVSWVSKLREEPGRLYFPVDRYSKEGRIDGDVRFVVLHHPLNWFNQSIYRSFRTFVRKIADIVISGHEHLGNVGEISDTESEKSAFVEGWILQGEQDLSDSSFNVVVVDLNQSQFKSMRHAWDGTRYVASEEGSWSDYHDLPAKRSNAFAISTSFQNLLDDPGAFFKHPGCGNINLSDIFIYPDLRKVNNQENRQRDFISSTRLLSPDVTANGLLIEGVEKAGCTSLLYQLFRAYHDRGFAPILLKGKDLRRMSDADIDAVVKHAVEAQYGEEQLTAFEQLPSTKKLLLLDDFDESPLKAADARAGLVRALRKRFAHIVVTVSEMFEMREMLERDGSREPLILDHYVLQPFGYLLRSKLIKRWYSLGSDGTVDEATLMSRCDQAERLMNAVMTKTIIPSLPLYLLTLLQSMEAGRSGDFKDSALGYYYQYLLTEAFQSAGVKADKLTEVFQYAAQLAWEFHLQRKRELSEVELRDFNARFSKEWHTVDFADRLSLLIKARVLCRVGEDYAFRYPYIFYFLKGQYLSEKLADPEIRAYIGRCCTHLYVRDNANTVLFLAHHTSDDYVINSIADALHGLFRSCAPVVFNGDTASINKLIENAPKLTYSGESPTDHRERRNVLQDQLDDGHDGLTESEEGSSELSLVAQIAMLFKTTEILGQVLKNQYAKIQRTRKSDLITELFNGPLRALRNCYEFFEKNPDALVAGIEAAIEREGNVEKEERTKIARKFVGSLIQLITFSFLMRAAQGASSDSLLEDVRDVVKRNGTTAFRMIELCILLDSPKALPKQKLVELYEEVKKDVVGFRLLQIMVLNRLYMFKTAEQDMQWLSQKLDLGIGIQHAISYQQSQRRRLK